MDQEQKPFIPASTNLPETTIKAILLGLLLSMLLGGANAYLGLFAGMTVSASIPAAVISMAVLKLFKKSNVLENNAVQTAASAGESLSAGVIFTIPALILMDYWTKFNYLETMLIALAGGVLGVLFTVPLRKMLIVKQKLQFPEGVATVEVLKSGAEGGKGVKYLAYAALIGAGVKLAAEGFRLWDAVFSKSALAGGRIYTHFSLNLSPALIAVGYIVGPWIAFLVFLGGTISWWVAIPIYIGINGIPEGVTVEDAGYYLWSTKIRYLGVGAMIIGGFWAILNILGAITSAVREGINAFKGENKRTVTLRTEYDTPMSWVILGIGILIIPIFIIYLREIENASISAVMTVLMIFAGFLFSAVAGYMAGLVGSSNNPISGITIATIMTSALILILLMGREATNGPAAAILIGAVVCCAAAIAGDNMQDLKAGHILGSTPFRQQIMQMTGVIAAALVLPFVLELLNNAYGIGSDSLPAPQAMLMSSVATGLFRGGLPWNIMGFGAGLAVIIIIVDQILKSSGSSLRMPVLAVAVGLYLPFELDSSIMLGGLVALFASRYQRRQKQSALNQEMHEVKMAFSGQTGLLFASGLITGEALVGIFLAIPIAITQDPDVLRMVQQPYSSYVGLAIILTICALLYYLVKQAYQK
ncbi:oligopeptide transporter, OPT family [soil metagenome]